MSTVIVQVPASTSNLGPGFDCLGVALRLYNTVTIRREERPGPSFRVVDQAAALFFRKSRVRRFFFSCKIEGAIPRSRGLGSSASLRLGVLCGLNRLAGSPLARLSILQLAAQLEGHPDNVAPSLLGGFTVVRGASVQRFDVSPRLYFVLLIPAFEIRTAKARKVLPAKIGRLAAVESSANACAITAAFVSRNYQDLKGAFVDRLHQPFRKKLIPFLPRVIAAAEKAGALGAFLSGSGSAIAAVTLKTPKRVAAGMQRATGATASRAAIVRADNQGVRFLSVRSSKSEIRHRLHGPGF